MSKPQIKTILITFFDIMGIFISNSLYKAKLSTKFIVWKQ